jgi:hypothetical protein
VPHLKDNVRKTETDYYVHVVVLNKDDQKTKEFRIKDWARIFQHDAIMNDQKRYNLGITAEGILVVSDSETLYYL